MRRLSAEICQEVNKMTVSIEELETSGQAVDMLGSHFDALLRYGNWHTAVIR